jgi:long-chain acyl-CoA synthetase
MVNSVSILARVRESRARSDIILKTLQRSYTLKECEMLLDEFRQYIAFCPKGNIGLLADNRPEWILLDLLLEDEDRCIVPIPTFFSQEQILEVIVASQLETLICDADIDLPSIDFKLVLSMGELRFLKPELNPSNKAKMPVGTKKITFTSGSTGQPKGVCLSHQQLKRQAEALAEQAGQKKPVHLCLLPLSTLLENIAGVYTPLLSDGIVVVPSLVELGFRGSRLVNPQQMLAVITQTNPTTMILIPELLRFLVSAALQGWQPPSSLQFIAVGGGAVSSLLLEQAYQIGLPVYEGYGLSECGSVVSLNTPDANLRGSCGKPLPHLTVTAEDGEISVNGNAMLGYLNDPDSWYPNEIRTGDLGYLDEQGYVHLSGRKKNLLISSYGRNINPEWPESALLANTAIQEAVVFGDAQPYCVALFSLRNGPKDIASLAPWIDRVNKTLPDYAQIKKWQVLNEVMTTIPGLVTSNGRPKRREIAAYYEKELASLYLP